MENSLKSANNLIARLVPGVLSCIAIFTGIIALTGWLVSVPVLSSFGSAVPMAPITALLFIVFGFLIYLLRFDNNHLIPLWVRVAFGYTSVTLALLLGLLSFFGIHLQIEHLGIPISGMVENVPLGHISPLTAFLFFLIGISHLLLLGSKPVTVRRAGISLVLSSLVVLSSFVLVLAYLLGSPVLYGSSFIPPALSTSISFILLGMTMLIHSGKLVLMNSFPIEIYNNRSVYYLASSFLLLAIGIILAGFWYYRNFESHYKDEVGRQLSAIAKLKVNQIISWRNERYADAYFLYNNTVFEELTRELFNGENPMPARDDISSWFNQIQKAHHYERISLMNPSGDVIIQIPLKNSFSSSVNPGWIREVVSSPRIVFHDLIRDKTDLRIYMSILVPIRDRTQKKVSGIVEIRIDPEIYLFPMIKNWPVPSVTAENIIVRREGGDVLFLNELRFKSNTALNLRSPLSDTSMPAVKAVLGRRGNVEGLDYSGEPVIAYITEVTGTPWYLVSRMDKKEVFTALRSRFWGVLILINALLICAAMAVAYIWRHQHVIFYKEKYQTAKALQASIERFVKAFQTKSVFMSIMHSDGTFVDVNGFVLRFLGYKQEELIGKSPDELGLFAEAGIMKKIREAMDLARHLENLEIKLLTKDGALRYGNLSIELLDAGEELYWLAVITDITAFKNSEERVLKLNRVYDLLSEINQAIVRIRDPRVLFETACKIAVEKGHLPLTWIGLIDDNNGKLMPVAWAGHWEGYLDKINLSVHEVPCGYCPIDQAIHDGNYHACSILTHANELKPCQREALGFGFRSIISFPLKVSGLIKGTINFYANDSDFFNEEEIRLLEELALDIAFSMEFNEKDMESQLAEVALAKSEKRLQLLIDGVKDYAIYSLDRSGFVTGWNLGAERLHGFQGDEVMGLHYSMFFTEEDQNTNKSGTLLERAALMGRAEEEGLRFHKNRSWFMTNSVISSLYNDDGSLFGFAVITQDITRRKQFEEELQRMNTMLEEKVKERTAELDAINKELESFSYSISHDLRAPLRAISGYATYLQEDYSSHLDKEGMRLLSNISSNAKRMNQLINDILTLSKISRKEINHTLIDMKTMAGGVFEELCDKEQLKKIKFTVADLQSIEGDPILIRQVWTNLISNAIKYTSKNKNPKIEIFTNSEPGQITYVIRDNGAGFDMKYYDKLFNIFQRLHSEVDFEGTGVGLAIVKRIIQRFSGQVWAEGKTGKGAAFYFSLPSA